MKKRLILIAALAVVLIGSAVGGTMAVYQASATTDKTISTSSIDIKLNIEGTEVAEDGTVLFKSTDVKDGAIAEKVSAVNTGSKNVYVRIRVNKAWYSGNTKIFEVNGVNLDGESIGVNLVNTEDWIVPAVDADDDGEDMYIYYNKILKAKETTSTFMDSFTLFKDIKANSNIYSGLSAKMRFDADAIQTTAAKDAMVAEWGVIATLDGDGNITSIVNQ